MRRLFMLAALMSLMPVGGAAAQPASAGEEQNAPVVTHPLPSPQPAPAASTLPNLPSTYVLGIDDTLVIHVGDMPDINDKTQRIDPNGDLRLPVIGRVHAAGMSVDQLEADLKRQLGVYLQQPDVTVMVTSSRTQTVSIIGAVTSPESSR